MKYIVGDSHLRLFQQVLDNQGMNADDIEVHSGHALNLLRIDVSLEGDVLRGKCHQNSRIKARDLELRPGDCMVISAPLHSSLVARHKMWRRYAPWQWARDRQGISPVSDNIFRILAEERSQAVENYLRAGLAHGARVAILEPPFLPRRVVPTSGIDAELLSICDKAFRDAVRAVFDKAGIPIIPTPPETHDGDFMLDQFAAKNEEDMHHGNHAYVRHAIAKVLAFFEAETADNPDTQGARITS